MSAESGKTWAFMGVGPRDMGAKFEQKIEAHSRFIGSSLYYLCGIQVRHCNIIWCIVSSLPILSSQFKHTGFNHISAYIYISGVYFEDPLEFDQYRLGNEGHGPTASWLLLSPQIFCLTKASTISEPVNRAAWRSSYRRLEPCLCGLAVQPTPHFHILKRAAFHASAVHTHAHEVRSSELLFYRTSLEVLKNSKSSRAGYKCLEPCWMKCVALQWSKCPCPC